MSYDVAIVGAGPAGMSAAVRLRALGACVIVIDEQPAPGGQVFRGIERNAASPVFPALGEDYAKGGALVAAFRASGAEYLPSTQVWQIEDGWNLFLTTGGTARRITARSVLLANGAQERPVPFPGWTLPNVMTVGAAQILLKSGGMLPEGRIWIAGAGPLPLLYATQLLNLGGRIAGYLDTSTTPKLSALVLLPGAWREFGNLFKGLRWLRKVRRSGMMVKGFSDLRAEGEERLEHLTWEATGKRHRVEADVLLVHEGVVPRIHETLALKCDHIWNEEQGYLAPKLDGWGQTSREGLFVAGDAGGIGGWTAATVSGEITALGIAGQLGIATDPEHLRRTAHLDKRRKRALALRPFLDAVYPPPRTPLADDVIACRCEEVTAGAIRSAARNSPPDPSAVKAATRCGMGPCQGRQCGYTVQALLAEVHNLPVGNVSFFHIRPPLKPITLGEIASLENTEGAA
ncbi:NADPH-dependent 2,4-dienoyl-CoA reductase/sulfur reductase-like enzyme [Rhizobium sp. BK077]|uniref:NAD(P)/FAD-dependent oxidoreductase n=1 Tax=unclassified Rhizobium TaxID=2613769 RepID=UPI00161C294F|nr:MULTISPECIES: NAD(P)/FAD-dependent oxidoreductase [unclassified Rhizobium]MBB3303404.1 NADPH-dependent 2,4-dienoyl-CoA reductase/sulfur reductase-like enzyme [Rhizobium sp. BK112]MBB3372528.1 NADPH-dependent 2,4-dienoyl-CoA reductase/sulfur reductase-like enzyme [Rhizobium sp. BK077]MBB4183300.1 NADPH-dependent 2,4-dienoyl-CoA reductase/sulfur reductase-like enzyme [Rhizobium sp. BK109]MBB4255976.1 NADPH-dependent 2,4-dienoyl-CoA reductase/sulfur reductase-like enzyme [Rhizobium sp. BK008]